MRKLVSIGHTKSLILYHFIFVPKYRHKIFSKLSFSNRLKELMIECSENNDFIIETQEIDKDKPDHWHGMIRSSPSLSPSQIARSLKQYTAYHLWKEFPEYLSNFYWYDHKFWTRGYYVATIGNVSADAIRKYIEEQGN